LVLAFLFVGVSQPCDTPAKKPTELERLVKSKSIDKLRAKFLQAVNDDERDDARAAIMSVVSNVYQERSKAHVAATKEPPLDWPDHEHRGYIHLNKAQRKSYNTLYGKHLSKDALEEDTRRGHEALTRYQLIIVAGPLVSRMSLLDCVVVCDSLDGGVSLNECVVVAASDLRVNGFSKGLVVSNGRVDIHSGDHNAVYTRGDIFLTDDNMTAKQKFKAEKVAKSYLGDGKIADTGLTFFQLADLGVACKLDADKAVVVESVKAGSPADVGKLKAGDVLSLVNLRRVKSLDKVEELFRYAMMDGPKAKVAVLRGQESLDLEILFP